MTDTPRDELLLSVGDTGAVWREVVAILPRDTDILCDFCNHPGSVAERGTVAADYIFKVGHGGVCYCCDWCVDPAEAGQESETETTADDPEGLGELFADPDPLSEMDKVELIHTIDGIQEAIRELTNARLRLPDDTDERHWIDNALDDAYEAEAAVVTEGERRGVNIPSLLSDD